MPLQSKYPGTAIYNCFSDSRYLVHRFDLTDPEILELAGGREMIHVRQGYCRCGILAVGEGTYLTSDPGTERALREHGLDAVYFDPAGIRLDGFPHGFIGGCAGMHGDKLFLCGAVNNIQYKYDIKAAARRNGIEIVELYGGPLIDIGGIIAVENS